MGKDEHGAILAWDTFDMGYEVHEHRACYAWGIIEMGYNGCGGKWVQAYWPWSTLGNQYNALGA